MNLKNIVRDKIIEVVLNAYDGEWATLIYDETVAYVIQTLFRRSDFPSYGIMTAVNIEEERASWDFPAIYFVEGTAKNVETINSEFESRKYSSIRVFCLNTLENLDPLIKSMVIDINIRAVEEQIFISKPEDLTGLFGLFNEKISIHYLPEVQSLAEDLQASQNDIRSDSEETANSNIFLLLVNREVDLFTPLLHFFSFRSAVSEMNNNGEVSCDDLLYPDLRNKHLAEGGPFLKQHVSQLSRNQEQLGSKKLDTASLSKMVVDAPKNIEIKEAIEKYSSILGKAINNLEFLKDIVEAEQVLVTEYDKRGKKVKKNLDFFFEFLGSTKYSMEDRLRLLFLLKANKIAFSNVEQKQLAINGFDEKYISAEVDTRQQIKRNAAPKYDYDVSRYQPIVADLISGFMELKPVFQRLGPAPDGLGSLRRNKMLTGENKRGKRTVILYICGGLSVEECCIAYNLSDALSIDLCIGSDKMLTPSQFIDELAKTSR